MITPVAFKSVIGSRMMAAARIIVTIGNMVTTMDASIGEVMDNPMKKGNWFNVKAKKEAKNNIKISFGGTCSLLQKIETIQKSSNPPLMRKKVSVYGLSISGISVLEIGLFNPKIKFADKIAICPLILFFSISGTKVRKNLKFLNTERETRNTKRGTLSNIFAL